MLSGHSWRVAVQRRASQLDLEWKIHFLTQFEKKSCIGKAPTKQSLLDAGGKPNQTTTKKKIKTNMIREMAGMGNDLLTHKPHKGGGWFYPIQSLRGGGVFPATMKTDKPCMCLCSRNHFTARTTPITGTCKAERKAKTKVSDFMLLKLFITQPLKHIKSPSFSLF